jgi:hypothetical protein
MNIEERFKELSEQAKERNLTHIHEAKTKKQAKWLAIQEKTPETAEFLKLFSESFGKPAKLKIIVDSNVIIDI